MILPHFRLISRCYYNYSGCDLSIVLKFLNKNAIIAVEKDGRMLDKNLFSVVKYIGKLNIALSGKSTVYQTIRESGTLAGSPGRNETGKCVRERTNGEAKVINESGTAAIAASYTIPRV